MLQEVSIETLPITCARFSKHGREVRVAMLCSSNAVIHGRLSWLVPAASSTRTTSSREASSACRCKVRPHVIFDVRLPVWLCVFVRLSHSVCF